MRDWSSAGPVARAAKPHRREVLVHERAVPPCARLAPLAPAREPVAVEACPDPGRWRVRERVAPQEAERAPVVAQELLDEPDEPRLRVAGRQGREPHEPVEPPVVRSVVAPRASRVTRLALELVLLPCGLGAGRAL